MPTGSKCFNLFISKDMDVCIRAFVLDGILNVQIIVRVAFNLLKTSYCDYPSRYNS